MLTTISSKCTHVNMYGTAIHNKCSSLSTLVSIIDAISVSLANGCLPFNNYVVVRKYVQLFLCDSETILAHQLGQLFRSISRPVNLHRQANAIHCSHMCCMNSWQGEIQHFNYSKNCLSACCFHIKLDFLPTGYHIKTANMTSATFKNKWVAAGFVKGSERENKELMITNAKENHARCPPVFQNSPIMESLRRGLVLNAPS